MLLLPLLLLLLILNAIARVENGVDYLPNIILDVTIELSTHCLKHWQDRLLEDSRFLNSSTNQLKRLFYGFSCYLIPPSISTNLVLFTLSNQMHDVIIGRVLVDNNSLLVAFASYLHLPLIFPRHHEFVLDQHVTQAVHISSLQQSKSVHSQGVHELIFHLQAVVKLQGLLQLTQTGVGLNLPRSQ